MIFTEENRHYALPYRYTYSVNTRGISINGQWNLNSTFFAFYLLLNTKMHVQIVHRYFTKIPLTFGSFGSVRLHWCMQQAWTNVCKRRDAPSLTSPRPSARGNPTAWPSPWRWASTVAVVPLQVPTYSDHCPADLDHCSADSDHCPADPDQCPSCPEPTLVIQIRYGTVRPSCGSRLSLH